MISLLAAWAMFEAVERTPAIYRCPRADGETDRFVKLVNEAGYDSICIDPSPGPRAKAVAAAKVKFVSPGTIDNGANRKWRDATIAFANGKISPKQWLKRTHGLRETVHFLSSPKTPELRAATPFVPSDHVYSSRSVFAELFLLSLPGRPCLTAGDVWSTRELPDAGRLQSWVLAMNDWLGPMLYYRHKDAVLVTGKLKVLRADPIPGLLVFSQTSGKHVITFYLNNSERTIELPPIPMERMTINRGLNMDTPKPSLVGTGFLIVDEGGKD